MTFGDLRRKTKRFLRLLASSTNNQNHFCFCAVTMANLLLVSSRVAAFVLLLCSHAAVAYYLPGVNPQSFAEGDV